MEVSERAESRSTLPSLPPPRSLERELPVSRGTPADGYRPPQQSMPHSRTPISEPGVSPYRENGYGYPYHHPTRYQISSLV
ncbi:hypothetical protein LB505_009664 [Fusarium chuoi]|nr:hypothetical protein LB505_009664 [Fusarium chuoi]